MEYLLFAAPTALLVVLLLLLLLLLLLYLGLGCVLIVGDDDAKAHPIHQSKRCSRSPVSSKQLNKEALEKDLGEEYWLFNRDPYNGLLQSLYIWVVQSPIYPKQPGALFSLLTSQLVVKLSKACSRAGKSMILHVSMSEMTRKVCSPQTGILIVQTCLWMVHSRSFVRNILLFTISRDLTKAITLFLLTIPGWENGGISMSALSPRLLMPTSTLRSHKTFPPKQSLMTHKSLFCLAIGSCTHQWFNAHCVSTTCENRLPTPHHTSPPLPGELKAQVAFNQGVVRLGGAITG